MRGVDVFLENLHEGRWELVLGGWDNDDKDEEGVDRPRSTEQSDDDDGDGDDDDALAERLVGTKYASLRDRHWKPTLDRLHTGIASRSGGGSSSAVEGGTEFRGKAVGTLFWEQVPGTAEHERS